MFKRETALATNYRVGQKKKKAFSKSPVRGNRIRRTRRKRGAGEKKIAKTKHANPTTSAGPVVCGPWALVDGDVNNNAVIQVVTHRDGIKARVAVGLLAPPTRIPGRAKHLHDNIARRDRFARATADPRHVHCSGCRWTLPAKNRTRSVSGQSRIGAVIISQIYLVITTDNCRKIARPADVRSRRRKVRTAPVSRAIPPQKRNSAVSRSAVVRVSKVRLAVVANDQPQRPRDRLLKGLIVVTVVAFDDRSALEAVRRTAILF